MRLFPSTLFVLLVSYRAVGQSTSVPVIGEYVTVWRYVRNDFYDKTFPSTEFKTILASSPPRTVVVRPGETVSTILKDNYNISETWTPAVYHDALNEVARLSSLADVNNVQVGTRLVLPELPRTGKSEPGSSALNKSPALAVGLPSGQYTWSEEHATFDGTLDPRSSVGKAPQMELQFFRLPAKNAKSYLAALDESGGPVIAAGQSGKVVVQLAEAMPTPQAPARILSDSVSLRLRQQLSDADPHSPRPILVILDDSIPDNIQFAAAKAFVLDLSATIRDRYGLGPSPYAQVLDNLPAQMVSVDDSFLYPNRRLHSALIHTALDEFTALDPLHRVSIVYLPLGVSEVEFGPLLKELIYLAQLLRIANPSLESHVTAQQFQRDQAEKVTEAIVNDNASVFVSAPLQQVTADQLFVATDSAILESLSLLLRYYSDATRRPHFLSFSWTVPDLQVRPYFEPGAYGWKFVAAGNGLNGGFANVLHSRLQFAYRSFDPKDFVVVANSTGTPSHCPSNTFDDTPQVQVLGLAFPGSLDDSFCGTSFSTPRLAWLFAAREVINGKTIPPGDESATRVWISDKIAFVMNQQKSSGDFFQRYQVDVVKFMGW